MQPQDGNISGELWEKLIDEIARTNPGSIVIPFWRGESLLHPDFEGLLKYALSRSVRIHISTNGHSMTESQSRTLTRCEFVTFSVHTLKGYSNAKQFLSLREGACPLVQLSFVRGEETAARLLETVLASPDLEGFDSIRLYEEHTKEGVFGRADVSKDPQRRFCNKLQDTLVIAYDGSFSRCNHIWVTENGINLNGSSIAEVWTSAMLERIRGAYPDDRCGKCDQWIGHTLGESWRMEAGRLDHRIFAAGNRNEKN